jgi:hypothetical protein
MQFKVFPIWVHCVFCAGGGIGIWGIAGSEPRSGKLGITPSEAPQMMFIVYQVTGPGNTSAIMPPAFL